MIEFRKGEKWCRWNGILMSPTNHKKLFGTNHEIWAEKGYIVDNSTIYTDKPIGKILAIFGKYYPNPEEDDRVIGQGYGWEDHEWEKKLANSYVFNADFIKNLKVKPMAQFAIDYPNFNQKDHNAFYDELEKYYDKIRKSVL